MEIVGLYLATWKDAIPSNAGKLGMNVRRYIAAGSFAEAVRIASEINPNLNQVSVSGEVIVPHGDGKVEVVPEKEEEEEGF